MLAELNKQVDATKAKIESATTIEEVNKYLQAHSAEAAELAKACEAEGMVLTQDELKAYTEHSQTLTKLATEKIKALGEAAPSFPTEEEVAAAEAAAEANS